MNGTLENVLQILSATSDQSFDDLVDLLKPDEYSREEMQETYEETLGYDPTTYYDRRDMQAYAERLANDLNTPNEAVDYIKDQGDALIDEAFDQFNDSREVFLQAAVEQVITDATGVEIDIDLSEDYEDLMDDEDSDDNEEDSEEYDDSDDEY